MAAGNGAAGQVRAARIPGSRAWGRARRWDGAAMGESALGASLGVLHCNVQQQQLEAWLEQSVGHGGCKRNGRGMGGSTACMTCTGVDGKKTGTGRRRFGPNPREGFSKGFSF